MAFPVVAFSPLGPIGPSWGLRPGSTPERPRFPALQHAPKSKPCSDVIAPFQVSSCSPAPGSGSLMHAPASGYILLPTFSRGWCCCKLYFAACTVRPSQTLGSLMFCHRDVCLTFVEFPSLSHLLMAAGQVLFVGTELVNPGGCNEDRNNKKPGIDLC